MTKLRFMRKARYSCPCI